MIRHILYGFRTIPPHIGAYQTQNATPFPRTPGPPANRTLRVEAAGRPGAGPGCAQARAPGGRVRDGIMRPAATTCSWFIHAPSGGRARAAVGRPKAGLGGPQACAPGGRVRAGIVRPAAKASRALRRAKEAATRPPNSTVEAVIPSGDAPLGHPTRHSGSSPRPDGPLAQTGAKPAGTPFPGRPAPCAPPGSPLCFVRFRCDLPRRTGI